MLACSINSYKRGRIPTNLAILKSTTHTLELPSYKFPHTPAGHTSHSITLHYAAVRTLRLLLRPLWLTESHAHSILPRLRSATAGTRCHPMLAFCTIITTVNLDLASMLLVVTNRGFPHYHTGQYLFKAHHCLHEKDLAVGYAVVHACTSPVRGEEGQRMRG